MTALDPRALRTAFGRFMTGVTVITTCDTSGLPVGFTANSFTSVSLDPPLLLVCPGRFLSSFEVFTACSRFAVSILAEGQEDIANTFAGYKGDRFARVAHRLDDHGIPVIDGAIAHFSCTTHQVLPAGDHSILIGEVTGFTETDAPGLGYAGGQFFSLGLERGARDPAAKINICGAVIEQSGHVLLEQTPKGYRLPQCTAADHASLRGSLSCDLDRRGVTAQLGPVFSIFDDPRSRTHFAYLLARASGVASGCRLEAVPISDLPKLAYASPAIARMLERFAQEATTRNFSLYLGNTLAGETHQVNERV